MKTIGFPGVRIGIAGAGGIGSNVARHLAQAGVLFIKLVDFDHVEISNLNRQFYSQAQAGKSKVKSLRQNLLAISPGMEIKTITCRMTPGDASKLFHDCDIVVEGFDDKACKKMIIEELAPMGIRLVSASGIAGSCMDTVGTRKLGNCHIVGDFSSDTDSHQLFPPKVALVAAHMAAIVLKVAGKTAKTPATARAAGAKEEG